MNIDHHFTGQLKTLRLGGLLETLEMRVKQAEEQELDYISFLQLWYRTR